MGVFDNLKKKAEDLASEAGKMAEKAKDWSTKAVEDTKKWSEQAVKDASNISVDTVKEWGATTIKDITTNAQEFIESDKPKEIVGQVGDFTVKAAKTVSFVSAYEMRKEAKASKDEADEILNRTNKKIDETKFLANSRFETYGKAKCEMLQATVGRFIKIVDKLNNRVKDKTYELGTEIGFKEKDFNELKSVEMNASGALKAATAAGGMAAVALMGVPSAVTGAVAATCAASTGTAISSLSGIAAQNATLAWLGGGSIASGGGGVAAGAAVLTSITVAATSVFALVSASIVATKFYSVKNTEATQYLAATKEWEAKSLAAIEIMKGVVRRSDELLTVFARLEGRTLPLLDNLEARVETFSPDNKEDVELFQKTAMLVKTMSEIAQAPLINEEGSLNSNTDLLLAKSNKILNKSL